MASAEPHAHGGRISADPAHRLDELREPALGVRLRLAWNAERAVPARPRPHERAAERVPEDEDGAQASLGRARDVMHAMDRRRDQDALEEAEAEREVRVIEHGPR